ncbi:hypothetical protein F3J17_23560 [Burkholderia sp. Ax-1719]|nr:hypothetical protein [Burkholderia sp. Ax-1719]
MVQSVMCTEIADTGYVVDLMAGTSAQAHRLAVETCESLLRLGRIRRAYRATGKLNVPAQVDSFQVGRRDSPQLFRFLWLAHCRLNLFKTALHMSTQEENRNISKQNY